MSAAPSPVARPCPVCLLLIPAGATCPRARAHELARAAVHRRNLDRRATVGAWRARGHELAPVPSEVVTVALVGCGKSKAAAPARVRDLYRSPLFSKSVTLAELAAEHTFVASARELSLLELEEVREPYDVSLRSFDRAARERWASCLVADLVRRFPRHRVKLILLMGETYSDPIVEAVRDLRRLAWPAPVCLLERLPVGRRLSFLNTAISAARIGGAR